MFKRILIAVDPDDPSTLDAFPPAVFLAEQSEAEMIVCSIVPDTSAVMQAGLTPLAYREMVDTRRSKLLTITEKLLGRAVRLEIGTGSVASGVLGIAADVDADLIVLTSHRPGAKDHVWAAHGARIARRAACSVLVVRSPQT